MFETPLWIWGVFHLFIFLMLALDLGMFHNKQHEVKMKEALIWSGIWISISLLFNLGIYLWRGEDVALSFTAGYLLEKALSVDNLFVFVTIFSYFKVPPKYQHKVLFWGVLSALVMRAAFIFGGVALIAQFHWIMYLFGAFLIYTGFKMAFQKEHELKPAQNPLLRIVSRVIPVRNDYVEDHFFVKVGGKWTATPLFIALMMLETTDLLFAVDSIPAVIAVTHDPFIVYTSNIFAILGLRSLYFVIAGAVAQFDYLKYGLAAILSFVGAKMLLQDLYHIPIGASLGVIAALLMLSIGLSIRANRK